MATIARAKERAFENWVAVPAAVVFAAVLTYWMMVIDRVPPFNLSEGEITPAARELGPVTVRWRVTVNRNQTYSYECDRWIVDSTNNFHRVMVTEGEDVYPPDTPYMVRTFTVPRTAAWGRARYQQSCTYQVNGLSLTAQFPITIRRPPLYFHILPDK